MGVRNWASVIEPEALKQAERAARLPIVAGDVALMPDAHVGIGATVGSVIPTRNAIIPAAVGVDLGCGMIAVETSLDASKLPDDLGPYLGSVSKAIPAGVGRGHEEQNSRAAKAFQRTIEESAPATELRKDLYHRAYVQFGSLGSGNHFFEVCVDPSEHVWVLIHSGSRGIGNILATEHIERAKQICTHPLEDPDLAFFMQGTPEFDAYIADMLWAQRYALANREQMMDAALSEFFAFVGTGSELRRINCHHNFTARETFDGQELWITRKGAIRAEVGDFGVIPGSMGTHSYIVKGKGSKESWHSCSHGAGRRLSRGRARREIDVNEFRTSMQGRTWQDRSAEELIDEAPQAYKDIDTVMEDQKDLVEVVTTLKAILNYKGIEMSRRRKNNRA
ncbi:MAG: RtcB family protein [Actinomycetota bacterium]